MYKPLEYPPYDSVYFRNPGYRLILRYESSLAQKAGSDNLLNITIKFDGFNRNTVDLGWNFLSGSYHIFHD